MKLRSFPVTPDYLDDLADKMLEWVKKEDSLTVPQFLSHIGLGYPFLKFCLYKDSRVHNAFEMLKSVLHCRWLHMAMSQEDLPKHRAKVLMRYLRFYDSHALDVEQEMKERVEEAKVVAENVYLQERYDREELEQPYQQIYDHNLDKRRGEEEA